MKSIYWSSTLIIVAFLLLSAYSYFFSKTTIQGLKDLGFPGFFIVQLGVLKIMAVVVLLLTSIPLFVKDWGYAGVGFFLITAMVAHIAHRDSGMIMVLLVVLFVVLIASRYSLYVLSN